MAVPGLDEQISMTAILNTNKIIIFQKKTLKNSRINKHVDIYFDGSSGDYYANVIFESLLII